jgi:type I restriction enzyme S subunit
LLRLQQRRSELIAQGSLAACKSIPIASDEVTTEIPKHWRWVRLNELVSVIDSGWSPACDGEPTSDESEWGVLKTTAVQTMYFDQKAHKRLPSNLKPRPEAEAKTGDLLITRAGPQNRVGISCLVKSIRPRLMISDKIIRFHLIEPFLFEEFIVLCLNAGESQSHIERAKSGMAASQMNISQVKFRLTPIPIPPLGEQKRIVSKVTELMTLCDGLEAKLTQAESASTQLLSSTIAQLLSLTT